MVNLGAFEFYERVKRSAWRWKCRRQVFVVVGFFQITQICIILTVSLCVWQGSMPAMSNARTGDMNEEEASQLTFFGC